MSPSAQLHSSFTFVHLLLLCVLGKWPSLSVSLSLDVTALNISSQLFPARLFPAVFAILYQSTQQTFCGALNWRSTHSEYLCVNLEAT